MSTPGSVQIQRPYGTAEAYLAGDAWTVDRTEMVLVGAAGAEPGTVVKFEIALTTGEVVVRGEGRIVDKVSARGEHDEHDGGLRVRFLRLDAESKAMLRRALDVQKRAAAARAEETAKKPDLPPQADAPKTPAVQAARAAATTDAKPERSGVRHRATAPIEAPSNRDALLARLRQRA